MLSSMRRASVPLCFCALLIACTDPRARVAAPTVKLYASSAIQVTSPGTIPVSIYAYDVQGLDQVLVTIHAGISGLDGDTTFVLSDQNEQTLSLVWPVPHNVPAGTQITLAAKARNVIGFAAFDTLLVTVQP